MDNKKRDILAENPGLRCKPYAVPEGYFESFKAEMRQMTQPKQVSLLHRLMPYASIAAVFVFLVSAGTLFLQKFTPADDFTQEDYLVFSHNAMNAEYYDYESMDQLADAEIAAEDIIEYLIYSGITPEEIEFSK
ncbi:MAG: hypothetical protein IKU36_04440 [Bacteroidales bacterium]|nr:hypothetical protein [Bacteroidales bacterium]